MCIMSTPKPKVENVAPAPTPVSETDTTAVNDRISAENRRRRAARGADWARNQANDAVLTDAARGGSRQTLG